MGKFRKWGEDHDRKYKYKDKDSGEEVLLDRDEHYHIQGGLEVKIHCLRCGGGYNSMAFQGYCERCYKRIQSMRKALHGEMDDEKKKYWSDIPRIKLLVKKFCPFKFYEYESCPKLKNGICEMMSLKMNREIPCPYTKPNVFGILD